MSEQLIGLQEGQFGFLQPMTTGQFWSDGVQGRFIPVRLGLNLRARLLMDRISEAAPAELPLLWRKLMRELGIEFQFVHPPHGMRPPRPGFAWVRIVGTSGHRELAEMVGEKVAMIYPNGHSGGA